MARSKVIVDTRQIIDISFRIIKEEGEAALSARRIAKELNMSAMTLYNYVDNIDAIRKEVILQGFNLLYKSIYLRLDEYREETGQIALTAFSTMTAQALYAFGKEYPGIYMLMFRPGNSQFRKDAEIRPFYKYFTHIYGKFHVGKEKLSDLKKSFRMFDYIVHGLIVEMIEGIQPCTPEEFNGYVETYIARMFGRRKRN